MDPLDHPRSRGVYSHSCPASRRAQGSSPLARGLRERPRERLTHGRIIPARAGFTHGLSRRFAHLGSSPLARGLPVGVVGPHGETGIIPARAGFTVDRRPRTGARRDHPRSRGVYAAHTVICTRPSGSSPLARGLPDQPVAVLVGVGIIPARAGFTQPPFLRILHHTDHPRSRGVYRTPTTMRRTGPRIIPARAGFTSASLTMMRPLRDHPRSRGVYSAVDGPYEAVLGSSPLARGLHQIR